LCAFDFDGTLSPIVKHPNLAGMREKTRIPLAQGELFNNPYEWKTLITERLIDFIRIHISAVGGLNMARKVASCCEFFNVRTAWHGPGNVSPVGHAVNMHLDLATYNFGIQEQNLFSDTVQQVFPGAPEIKGGYMYAHDKPGLGVDIDEKLAAKDIDTLVEWVSWLGTGHWAPVGSSPVLSVRVRMDSMRAPISDFPAGRPTSRFTPAPAAPSSTRVPPRATAGRTLLAGW